MQKKKMKSKSSASFSLDKWISKQASSFKDAAERAKSDKGGFDEFDDGKYKMQLRELTIGPSQSSDRIQAMFLWKFLSGEYKGKTYRSYRGVSDADGQFYFVKDLQRLGYEIDEFDADDLPTLMKQIKKDAGVFKVVLKSKGEFQNALINGPAEEDDEEEIEEVDEDADGDGDEDEDEDDAPKKKKKSKKVVEEDDEEEEEDEEEDADEEEEEEEEAPKKKKKKKVVEEEEEEESDDEEEEEEEEGEEEEPVKKKKKKKVIEEDEDEEEAEADDVMVVIGSTVEVKIKGKRQKAKVTEIFADDREVKVKTAEGKTVRIAADDILSVVDMPKKKKAKK